MPTRLSPGAALAGKREVMQECISKHMEHQLQEIISYEPITSFAPTSYDHKGLIDDFARLAFDVTKRCEERRGKKWHVYDEDKNKIENISDLDPSKPYYVVEDARNVDVGRIPHGREAYIAQVVDHAMKMLLYIEKHSSEDSRENERQRQAIVEKTNNFIERLNNLPEFEDNDQHQPREGYYKEATQLARDTEALFFDVIPASQRSGAMKELEALYFYGVPLARIHSNMACIQTFKAIDGQGHEREETICVANHILSGLTDQQVRDLDRIKRFYNPQDKHSETHLPVWFRKMPTEKKVVLRDNVDSILLGNKCFPTQANEVGLLRMGYDERIYKMENGEWQERGAMLHHAAPAVMSSNLTPEERQETSSEILKQIKSHCTFETVHIEGTVHYGGAAGAYTEESSRLAKPFLDAVKGLQEKDIYGSMAGITDWDTKVDFEGVKAYLERVKEACKECKEDWGTPLGEKVLAPLEERLKKLEELVDSKRTKQKDAQGNTLKPYEVHGAVMAGLAGLTAAAKSLGGYEEAFEQRLKLVTGVFCKSGKDRTGVSTLLATLHILNAMGIEALVDPLGEEQTPEARELALDNQRRFLAMNLTSLNGYNGGSGGCGAIKPVSRPIGMAEELVSNYEQKIADNNKPLEYKTYLIKLGPIRLWETNKGVHKRLSNLSKEGKLDPLNSNQGQKTKEVDQEQSQQQAQEQAQTQPQPVERKPKRTETFSQWPQNKVKEASKAGEIEWGNMPDLSQTTKEYFQVLLTSQSSLTVGLADKFKKEEPNPVRRNEIYKKVLESASPSAVKTEEKINGSNQSKIKLGEGNQEIAIIRKNNKLDIVVPGSYSGIITDYFTNSRLAFENGKIVDLTLGSMPHRFGEIKLQGQDKPLKLPMHDQLTATTTIPARRSSIALGG